MHSDSTCGLYCPPLFISGQLECQYTSIRYSWLKLTSIVIAIRLNPSSIVRPASNQACDKSRREWPTQQAMAPARRLCRTATGATLTKINTQKYVQNGTNLLMTMNQILLSKFVLLCLHVARAVYCADESAPRCSSSREMSSGSDGHGRGTMGR